MKKLFTFFALLLLCLYYCQINNELAKVDIQKVTTKNHEKSLGLDINISYPADWTKTDGKRPHMLFNFVNPDKTIKSTFGIKDILESASAEEKKAFRLLSDGDIKKIMIQSFPNSKNCSSFFNEMGIENPKNSTCRITKFEGIESSVSSTFGKTRRAEFTMDFYFVYYQIPYKTKIINIGFYFQNIKDEQDRFLADNLSNKIINSIVINNLWK